MKFPQKTREELSRQCREVERALACEYDLVVERVRFLETHLASLKALLKIDTHPKRKDASVSTRVRP